MPKLPVDGELVSALALGMSPEQAALRVGCHFSTVYRRLKEPAFQDALDAARARLGAMPEDMGLLYETLDSLRRALRVVRAMDRSGIELSWRQLRDSLEAAERWCDEVCWLREIEPLERAA